MAFKTAADYKKDKYGKMLVLANDQDYVDIVLMYRDYNDVLLADVHYLKSDDYSGYVHCLGRGCPACNHITPGGTTGIRIQPKLFIPMYNVLEDELMFFDRSVNFEIQLQTEVFSKYPNPADYVFRLTRHGVARDVDTKYAFMAVGTNSVKKYDEICAQFNTSFPEYYETVCKSVDAVTMQRWLTNIGNPVNTAAQPMVDYTITPRTASNVNAPGEGGSSSLTPPPTFTAGLSEDDDIEDDIEF